MTIGHGDGRVHDVAMKRRGVFTRADVIAAGLSDRQIGTRLSNGIWVEVLPRVYAHRATLHTPDVHDRAALLWAGGHAYLSHRSAAVRWGFDAVHAPRPEITVVGERHPRHHAVIAHRTTALPPKDRARIEGLRVTSPTRTIIDLAAVLDPTDLRVAFESARRTGHTSVAKVRNRMRDLGGRGRPGATQLNHLLALLDGKRPSEYPLEVLVAQLLDAAGVEAPVRQYDVRAGGRTYRLDFAWPARRLALECDGRLRHSQDGDFQRDRSRWSALAAIGWRLLFVTWADATRRPDEVLARVQVALAA